MQATEAPKPILSAHDLLAKMRAGVRETYEIRLRDLVVPMRMLSIDEYNMVRREAMRLAAGGDDTDMNLAKQKLILKMASNSMLSEKLVGMMSTDEVVYLYDEYLRIMDTVNPNVETISKEEFAALVDALKKNSATSRDFSLLQLRAICTAYADLIRRLDSQDSPKGS